MRSYTTVSQDKDGTQTTETARYARNSGRLTGKTVSESGTDAYGNQYAEKTKYNSRGRAVDSSYTDYGQNDKKKIAQPLYEQENDDRNRGSNISIVPSDSVEPLSTSYAQPDSLGQMANGANSLNKLNSINKFDTGNNNANIFGNSPVSGDSLIPSISSSLYPQSSLQQPKPFTSTPLASPLSSYNTEDLIPRKNGGPVKAGEAYVVAEDGKPEVFIPEKNGVIVPNSSNQSNLQGYTPVGEQFNNLQPSEQASLKAAIAADRSSLRNQGRNIALPTAEQAVWDPKYNNIQPVGVSKEEIQRRHNQLALSNPNREIAHRVEVITGRQVVPQYFEAEGFNNQQPWNGMPKGRNFLSEQELRGRLSNSNNYKDFLLNPDYDPSKGESKLYSRPRTSIEGDYRELMQLSGDRRKQAELDSQNTLRTSQSEENSARALAIPIEIASKKDLNTAQAESFTEDARRNRVINAWAEEQARRREQENREEQVKKLIPETIVPAHINKETQKQKNRVAVPRATPLSQYINTYKDFSSSILGQLLGLPGTNNLIDESLTAANQIGSGLATVGSFLTKPRQI